MSWKLMLVKCPNCGQKYEVDPDLPKEENIKCECGHILHEKEENK